MDVSIAEECARNVLLNYAYLKEKINSGAVVYGINTGFGGSADVRHSDTAKIQNTLIQHQNAGKDVKLGSLRKKINDLINLKSYFARVTSINQDFYILLRVNKITT